VVVLKAIREDKVREPNDKDKPDCIFHMTVSRTDGKFIPDRSENNSDRVKELERFLTKCHPGKSPFFNESSERNDNFFFLI